MAPACLDPVSLDLSLFKKVGRTPTNTYAYNFSLFSKYLVCLSRVTTAKLRQFFRQTVSSDPL